MVPPLVAQAPTPWYETPSPSSFRPLAEDPAPRGLVVAAIVLGLLVVAGVAWLTLRDTETSETATRRTTTSVTDTVAPRTPMRGQTRPIGDGWLTYRTPDGAWLFDVPAAPSVPQPLPFNDAIQMAYAEYQGGNFGFGWSDAQLLAGADETATLIDIMRSIARSRGAGQINPVVLPTDRGPVVTAELRLTGGRALFVLRSVDRRPVIAMVVAGLGDPDPAIANRILDSFRPHA
ncbi:MAG: hypothetical protein K1X38_18085 [Microthrixaceae bacterium]|nr:hypothetical protein [Microthrixaceae bacterium]